MRHAILTICLLIVSTSPRAHAQGSFVPSGRNGSELELFYSGSGQGNVFGVSGGYSISGRVDIDMTVAQITKGKITELGPGMRFHFLKETDHNGVDLCLSGAYLTYLFGREKYTGNSRGIDLVLTKTLPFDRKASLVSMLGYGYGWTNVDLKDRYGHSDKRKASTGALSLGWGAAFYRENSTIIVVTTGVTLTRNNTDLHISLSNVGISGGDR